MTKKKIEAFDVHGAEKGYMLDIGIKEKDITLVFIREGYRVEKECKPVNELVYQSSLYGSDISTDRRVPVEIYIEHLRTKFSSYEFIDVSARYEDVEIGLYNRVERDENVSECEKRLQVEAKTIIRELLKEKKEYEMYLDLKEKYGD